MNRKKIISLLCCFLLASCNSNNDTSLLPSNNDNTVSDNSSSSAIKTEYSITIDSLVNGTVSSEKNTYQAGQLVKLNVVANDSYYLKKDSLTYNGNIIDDSFSFIMPNSDVNISATFLKDTLPKNYIYGLDIKGHGQWNMAMIDYENAISLTNVSALLVEVRFNDIIENSHFRLAAMTSDGTVYDAFGKSSSESFYYSCDKDDYNAAAYYSWQSPAWGGWMPTWEKNIDTVPPTFYVEVPLENMFARFNTKSNAFTEGASMDKSLSLSQLGIHLTGTANYNFTIGKTYVRENGVVKQISNPKDYTDDNTSIYRIDTYGKNDSTLTKTIYNTVNEYKQTKKMLICGDSIMTRWWTHKMSRNIADTFNASLVRDTIGGTTIKDYDPKNENHSLIEHKNSKLYENYVKNNGEFDYIIIQRSTNDLYYAGVTNITNKTYEENMGNVNSTDENTVYGAIRTLIEYFHKLCPKAKIVMSTVLYRYDSVSDAKVRKYNEDLKTILNSYDFANCFDLYNLSGINETNYELYLNSNSHPHSNKNLTDTWWADNLHPNDDGTILLENVWCNYLKDIFK